MRQRNVVKVGRYLIVQPKTKYDHSQILALLREGKSVKNIATEIECSDDQIYKLKRQWKKEGVKI